MISVVMGVYNKEKYLARSIDSLLAQRMKPTKIILVDDQSTDGSLAICKMYEKKYEHIILVSSDKKCPGGARNVGLSFVRTKYVYFMDSDDYILPNGLETMYQCCEKYKLDLGVFESCYMDVNDKCYQRYDNFPKETPVMNGATLLEFTMTNELRGVNPPINLYRTSFLKENAITFEENTLLDDITTFAKLAPAVKRCKYSPNVIYHYRQYGDSIINSERDWASIYFESLKNLINYYQKNNISADTYPYIATMICYLCATVLLCASKQKESKKYVKAIKGLYVLPYYIRKTPKKRQQLLYLIYVWPFLLVKVLSFLHKK